MISPSTKTDLVGFFESRGFFGRSAPLYGGLEGVFDYGPLGAEVKLRLAASWRRRVIMERNDVESIDAALLSQPELLQYSGHVAGFDEELFRCLGCNSVGSEGQMETHDCPVEPVPVIQREGKLNLLFSSKAGVGVDATLCFLRPATAQQSYANFNRLMLFRGGHLPLGIAQIGKAFRNETAPDNYLCRMREFEQMELQFFIHPSEEQIWLDYWITDRMSWWEEQGIQRSRLTTVDVPDFDRAHYSKRTVDIYYTSDWFGSFEIEGIANRSDFDLRCHHKGGLVPEASGMPNGAINYASNEKTDVQDGHGSSFFCSAIEPAAGLDRGVFAVLLSAYCEELTSEGWRRVLRLPKHLSPRDLTFLVTDDLERKAAEGLKRALLQGMDAKVVIEQTNQPDQAVILEDERGTFLTAWFETDKIVLRDRDTGRLANASIANAQTLLSSALS